MKEHLTYFFNLIHHSYKLSLTSSTEYIPGMQTGKQGHRN